jgi:predicted Zn-dependent protease
MRRIKNFLLIAVVFLLTVHLLLSPAALSITVKEEEELAREFMRIVLTQFELIEDPVIVDYVNKIGRKIVSILPPQPFTYRFYIVNEDVYNAFATPAGNVFIYSGLIIAMESEEEIAGILGHEIAHVYCRHISQKIERSKKIDLATLAGIAAGIFLGAGGSGEVASAVTIGSMAAGQSLSLAYSRENEIQADQLGLNYIVKSGYSAEGLLTILNKIRARSWFGSDQIPTYLTTHPAVEDRIAYIDTWLDKHRSTTSKNLEKKSDDFKKVHARLLGMYGEEDLALSKFEAIIKNDPASFLGYYGYGLVLARTGDRKGAITYLKKALEREAFSPEILTALGRVYFQDGQYDEALSTLEGTVRIFPNNPEARFFLGRTQLESGKLQQAASNFQTLINQNPGYKQVYYFLGMTYGKQGKLADAHYSLGVYYLKKGDPANASKQFERALSKTENEAQRQKIEKLLKKINPKGQNKKG